MKIINRYVLKEHVGPFVFALSTLTSLLLLQYIARRFGDLVGRGLSWQVIVEFFLLSIPFTLAMTLPMSVLVAVLFAFSRMASENEITALKAGGVSARALMIPAVVTSFFLAGFMLWFNDQLLPRANHELATLQLAILRTKPTFALKAQVINAVREGQLYLRAGQIDEASGLMTDVTIYDLSAPDRRRTIYADSGTLAFADNRRDLNMKLYHGVILSVPSNNPEQVNRIYYVQDHLKIKDVANQFQSINADTASKGDREMSVCEMQRGYNTAHASVHRAYVDSTIAAWRINDERGEKKGEKMPEYGKVPDAGGIGAIYCSLINRTQTLIKNFKVKEAAAAEVTPVRASLAAPTVRQNPHNQETPQIGNNWELSEAHARLEEARHRKNRYGVEIQKKFSLATACIVFVLVGAPLALRFPRGGVGLVIGASFFVFAVYYIGLIGGESLANKNIISPFWAMWADNIVFLIVGLLLIARMGNEGVTSRGGKFAEVMDATRAWFAAQGRRVGFGSRQRANAS